MDDSNTSFVMADDVENFDGNDEESTPMISDRKENTMTVGALRDQQNDHGMEVSDNSSQCVDQDQTCGLSESGGLNGIKRTGTFIQDTCNVGTESTCNKRLRQSSSDDNLNAEMIQKMDQNISPVEANNILRDYKHALKLLRASSANKSHEPIPSLEYMIKLVNEWRPKSDIICMYVRWSKRLRRNYHLDSISTLLCVANQCDYSPHVFLKNIKTLTVSCSSTTYGLTFKFDTCRSKGIDDEKLNAKFLGLSITLRLLQRGIVSSSGTLGHVGLRTPSVKKPIRHRTEGSDDITLSTGNSEKGAYLVAKRPNCRFHTNAGLIGRIWLAIQHRWIAIQVVEMLFQTQLALARTEQESMAFSFQMHSSSGPTRYDFLDPLIGVCLRFRSTTIIDNHASTLGSVWEKPSSFVAFGNAYLHGTSETDIIAFVVEAFLYLKSLMKKQTRITMHSKTEREAKWQMVRGYAFHFWLERTSNVKLKTAIQHECSRSSMKTPNDKNPNSKNHVSAHQKFTLPPIINQIRHTTFSRGEDSQDDHSYTTLLGQLPLLSSRRSDDSRQLVPDEPVNNGQQEPVIETDEILTHQQDITPSFEHIVHNLGDPASTFWTSLRLATRLELKSRVSSHLLIHRDDGVDLIAELSTLELYSANLLYKLKHSRRTGPPGTSPTSELGKVQFSISAEVDKFIDQASKVYHVAREDSPYFKEHGRLLPSIQNITSLCQAVLKYGKTDTIRSSNQFRINIGCGGLHRPLGQPETLIGLSFRKSLEADPFFDEKEIIETIGRVTQFTWNVGKDMQVDAKDIPLAPDNARQRQYARHLAEYLGANKCLGFEDITVVVGLLFPLMSNVETHVDCMNDSVAGYTRTVAFNVVLAMDHAEETILLHLQVICNFRRVIREYLVPFYPLLSDITNNCKQYLEKWQKNINRLYGGKTPCLPSPFDRANFFLDDCLPFESIVISNGSLDLPSIQCEYLLTEINPSRVLSLSMFIDPIVDLKDTLSFDQRIELCFVASMLSNPFWFEYTITSLTRKQVNNEIPFQFDIHPLFDWSKETTTIFGSWQGGPYNRWSPCGGDTPFPNLFGAQADATKQEQKTGRRKLHAVTQVLYHHLQWVNSLRNQISSDVVNDLPLSIIESHMTSVSESIFDIVPCQFNVFRLMVFTTIAVGCGMVEPGEHLKALMYPVKGSASYNHLIHPNVHQITRQTALALCQSQKVMHAMDQKADEGVESERHDQLMLYLSSELGMAGYYRDETECVLCEAHPNRNLRCRDWFKKGRRIYDLSKSGTVLQRDYGINTTWHVMESNTTMKFAFLKGVIVYQRNDDELKEYAVEFGEVLRKSTSTIKFLGRNTRTSDCIQDYQNQYLPETWKTFPGIRYRAANFYNGDCLKQLNASTMLALGDGEMPAKLDSECNDVVTYSSGCQLWSHVRKMILSPSNDLCTMSSARYHQHQEESVFMSKTSVFPGHLDKVFVQSTVFVPLTHRQFFTIVAVPTSWYVKRNEKDSMHLQEWIKTLSTKEAELIQEFLHKFMVIAKTSMKEEVEMRIYSMSAGSLLAFPANTCFHTTITPGDTSSTCNPRDLFIIYSTTTRKE